MKKNILICLVLSVIFSIFGGTFVIRAADVSGSCGDGVYWTLDSSGKTLTISGKGNMKDYTINNNNPPWKANSATVESIIIENGVKNVGEYAFVWCEKLKNISFGNDVTVIGKNAFGWCGNLETLTLPKNITEIGDYAFVWCSKINSINIPASTKKIGNYAFAWCGSLTNITVSSENANFSAENGILFNKDKTTLALYPNGKKENLYVIPKSVKTIAQGAFFASYVKGIDFSNVESIQKDAFFGCESLSDIAFSNTLSEIGSTAFYGCTAITELDLPKSVTSIGESAFKNCSNLSSISLPGGISQIGDGAFANCNSLIADVYPGSYSELYVGNNNVKFQVVADVFLNNAQIVFDQKPVIINNRTLVPIRKICEALDLTVDWDETSQTAIITKGSTSIKIQINSTTVYKDNKSVTIDVPAQLIGNRTLVPVRAVSELFNVTVEWDSENSRVMLQK